MNSYTFQLASPVDVLHIEMQIHWFSSSVFESWCRHGTFSVMFQHIRTRIFPSNHNIVIQKTFDNKTLTFSNTQFIFKFPQLLQKSLQNVFSFLNPRFNQESHIFSYLFSLLYSRTLPFPFFQERGLLYNIDVFQLFLKWCHNLICFKLDSG